MVEKDFYLKHSFTTGGLHQELEDKRTETQLHYDVGDAQGRVPGLTNRTVVDQ